MASGIFTYTGDVENLPYVLEEAFKMSDTLHITSVMIFKSQITVKFEGRAKVLNELAILPVWNRANVVLRRHFSEIPIDRLISLL